jgi:ribosomal protein L7/L12
MNEVLDECRRLVESGAEDEQIFKFLRQSGRSRIDAIKVLVEFRGLPLPEAKHRVHYSLAWADMREDAERFHAQIERSVLDSKSDK